MKNISNKINNIITYIAFIIQNTVNIISEDKLLIIFFISFLVPNILIKITTEMPLINFRSFLFNLVWFFVLVALSYNFKKISSRVIYFGIITFLSFLLSYSNIMYYRFYQSFLSLSLIQQLTLFADVADATTVGISTFDILYWLLFTLCLVALIIAAVLRKFKYKDQDLESKIFCRFTFLRMSLIFLVIGVVTLQTDQYNEIYRMWDRPVVVEQYGLYNYHVADIVKSATMVFKPTPSEHDYLEFWEYFEEKNVDDKPNEFTGKYKDYNVIVIHAESFENFLVGLELNGREVTPNLNKLADSGIYFSNFYSQESFGTSSDSEFVFNTSLLPMNSGTIFLTYYNNTYITTPKLLKEVGYSTMSLHGNIGTFWNRDEMHPRLGYDIFIDENYFHYEEDQEIGLGLSDEEFFKQSIQYLRAAGEPYYANYITLTNHTPFDDLEKYMTYTEDGMVDEPLDCDESIQGSTLCNYFQSSHYADWALGEFIKTLDKYKMLDNTLIVLYGDHPADIPITEFETFYDRDFTKIEYNVDRKVPFIIWNKHMEEGIEVDKVMGMIDSAPTLQNMLGIKNPYSLGHDMFSVNDNLVVFPDGDWVDDVMYFESKNDYIIFDPYYEEYLDAEDYITIRTMEAEVLLTMSNSINRMDMIKHYLERKENGSE